MPLTGRGARPLQKTQAIRDSIMRGLYEPQFAGPNVVHPGAVAPQGWYEEKVAAAMGYPTLVRHETGPIGSYRRMVGSTNETPTDKYGQSWSSTAPQWMNVEGEWYNVSRPQAYMGDATMTGGGGIGSYTKPVTQPTSMAAIPAMLSATQGPLGAQKQVPGFVQPKDQWKSLGPASSDKTLEEAMRKQLSNQNMSYDKSLRATRGSQAVPQQNEAEFQKWWSSNPDVMQWRTAFKGKYGAEPNQNDPQYDYRSAWKSGVTPKPVEYDSVPHWASKFKGDDHPNRFIQRDGKTYDTKNEKFISGPGEGMSYGKALGRTKGAQGSADASKKAAAEAAKKVAAEAAKKVAADTAKKAAATEAKKKAAAEAKKKEAEKAKAAEAAKARALKAIKL